MLQLDRYWSLDICLDCLKYFTTDSLIPMSWFRPFFSCGHPRYIFQNICLNNIVELMLQNNWLFFVLVKHLKYKGGVAYFVALHCWFCKPLLHKGFRLIVYSLIIKIKFIDCRCHCLCLNRVFVHCFQFYLECWLEGLFWLARNVR